MVATSFSLSQNAAGLDGFVKEWGLDQCQTGDDPRVLAALQSFLNAVSPEAGYALSFSPEGTAATNFAAKRCVVTSEALREVKGWAQNTGVAFRVTAGFVLHEVGHIRYSQDNNVVVEAAFRGKPDASLAHTLSNVLDENRIERAMGRDFPGYATVFGHVLTWYTSRHPEARTPLCVSQGNGSITTRAEAFDCLVKAARFDRYTRWPYGVASVQAARDFGREWGDKYTVNDSTRLHLEGIRAAIAWLRTFPKSVEPAPAPEPQPGQGEGPDAQGGPGGQPGPSGASEPKPGDVPTDLSIEGDDEDENADAESASDGTGDDAATKSDDDRGDKGADSKSSDSSSDDADDESENAGAGVSDESDDDDDDDTESSGGEKGLDSSDDDADAESKSGETSSDTPSADPDKGDGDEVGGDSDTDATLDDIPEVADLDDAIKPTDADKSFDRKVEKAKDTAPTFDLGTALEGLGITKVEEHPTFNPYPQSMLGHAPDPVAIAAIEEAFTNTRLSNETYGGGYQSGRFRNGSVQRILNGSLSALYRRTLPSVTHLHLALVIDWSGSMAGGRETQANALAVNIEAALARTPEVRISVFHYTGTGQTLTRVWTTGDRTDLGYALSHVAGPSGGTPTASCLDATANLLEAESRPGEYTLVLSITDGEPNMVGSRTPRESVRAVVDYWRQRGIGILGLGVDVNISSIEEQYGYDAAVAFTGDWNQVGIDLAEVVGTLLNA